MLEDSWYKRTLFDVSIYHILDHIYHVLQKPRLTPLLASDVYRIPLLKGLVVSVGGLTEHTAKVSGTRSAFPSVF